jgi:SAM-dependent methyltransferase
VTRPSHAAPDPAPAADHVALNRAGWNEEAAVYAQKAPRQWSEPEPTWGVFGVPESTLGVLPPDLAGKDVVELGCGTAYVSSWLARRGARPVGVDLSENQLATARRMQRRFGLSFPLIHANAEAVPLRDERFDLAISEYGASIWCDPGRWIPEAARLLCVPDLEIEGAAGDRLRRDYFGMRRFAWEDTPEVEFHLGYGDWIRLLRANGLEVTDLIEVRPPEGAGTSYGFVTLEWARRWPCEEVWKARKRG